MKRKSDFYEVMPYFVYIKIIFAHPMLVETWKAKLSTLDRHDITLGNLPWTVPASYLYYTDDINFGF